MVTTRPRVSVIICAYTEERWELLLSAVRSMERQTVRAAETIVVVDHNPSLLRRATTDLPALAPLARVRVLPSRGRKGLSGARNTGVSAARYSVVAFLDDDACAADDWLEHLTGAYTDPSILGVGGKVVPEWQAGRPRWFPPEFDWVVGCTYQGVRSDAGPVRNFIGANMSFRKRVLRQVGGFRSELGRIGKVPLGCEETELCIRTRQQMRGTLTYEPAATVRHMVPPDRTSWRYFRSRCYSEGLSKAVVSELTEPQLALESERAYVRHVLPAAVVRSVGAALRGRPWCLERVVAVVAGVAFTGAGYVAGRVARGSWTDGTETGMSPRDGRRPGGLRPVMVTLALVVTSLVLWLVALNSHVRLDAMTDLGLMTVMPVAFWLGLTAITAAFSLSVTVASRYRHLPLLCVLVLVAMLHATPTILYGTLRYSWAWKHVAVVDYIQRVGHLDLSLSQLSAYQAWPGFFSLSALFDQAGGLGSALSYASWGPPVFESLFLAPLLLIIRQMTGDRRMMWTAVWFFYLGNWIGQDYFSPQAMAYFLYLVLIAVTLRYLRAGRATQPSGPGTDAVPPAPLAIPGRVLLALVSLLILTVATTHQLTPLMLISAFGFLWVFRQGLPRLWLAAATIITLGWILIAARSFLANNLYWIVRSIGHPDSNTTGTLINLSAVTQGQALVARIDRLLSLAVWLLAVVGLWRRRREARSDRPFVLLALSPLPLIVMNNYGGEMLFRVYLFALPFVAALAAASIFPRSTVGNSRWTAVAVFGISALLLAGFSFSYYGKEQMNYFTPDEVAAGEWVYSHAPEGSLILSMTSNWPYSYQHFDHYGYDWLALGPVQDRQKLMDDPTRTVMALMSKAPYGHSYLVFSRSQAAEIASLGLMTEKSVQGIEESIVTSPEFRVVFATANAEIVTLSRTGPQP